MPTSKAGPFRLVAVLSGVSITSVAVLAVLVVQGGSGVTAGALWVLASACILAVMAVATRCMNSTLRDADAHIQQHLLSMNQDLTRRARRLVEEAERAGQGQLDIAFPSEGQDVLAELGRVLQQMVGGLRELVGELQGHGIEIADVTARLAATTRDQEASATEEAASAREILVTIQRIAQATVDLDARMAGLAETARVTAEHAADGRRSIAGLEQGIADLSRSGEELRRRFDTLEDKARSIGEVVSAIRRIADRTNLLSLNAAIEAEKAGQHGRGFAVVAEEVRRLSDQTAASAVDIRETVAEIHDAVQAGGAAVGAVEDSVAGWTSNFHQLATALREVIERSSEQAPILEDASQQAREQALATEQIQDAAVQLAMTAQHTAEAIYETSASARRLDAVAASLQAGVGRFQLEA